MDYTTKQISLFGYIGSQGMINLHPEFSSMTRNNVSAPEMREPNTFPTIKTDIWEFVFFYGNESLLMTEYNLFDLSAEEIEEKVKEWKSEILIEKSDKIMQNLLKILDEE